MNFSLKKPCKNCPFLKEEHQPKNSGWLGRERAKGIYASMVIQDYSFPCHKTTTPDEDEMESKVTETTQHCAGALILLDKENHANQMSRIAMRLGMYDPQLLEDRENVVDTGIEFIDVHTRK